MYVIIIIFAAAFLLLIGRLLGAWLFRIDEVIKLLKQILHEQREAKLDKDR